MRILVTGGHGWIGRHVVNACLRHGHDVLVVSRSLSASTDHGNVRTYAHEITASKPLPDSLGAFDILIHLAWPIDPRTYLQSPENIAALHASLALIQSVQGHGCTRIVISGTCAEYAANQDRTALAEHDEIAPNTLYAACKHALHVVAQEWCRNNDCAMVWARIFHLYGPGEASGRLIPSLMQTLSLGKEFQAGSGKQVRDFLRVEDVADAFVALALADGVSGTFNIGSGIATSLAELMGNVHQLLDGQGNIILGAKPDRPWDPGRLVANADRLRALGWSPRYSLDSGLKDYLKIISKSEAV